MNNSYLIPANSKKSMLIFGLFKVPDLIILGVGCGLTLILLLVTDIQTIYGTVLAISPGLIAAGLVFPMPNYHNVRTFIKELYRFYTERRTYVWRGWCFNE